MLKGSCNMVVLWRKCWSRFQFRSPVTLTNGKAPQTKAVQLYLTKGNYFFYTDGSYVYNKNHQIMSNGYGLLGSSTQSAIIVPKPRNPYVYYIFTVDEPNELNADETTSNDRDAQIMD
jgi:hypothetical protein